MRAIPTTYAGVKFRSRLEADWAATLDDREIEWQYEPEGYELFDGTWYLPDFYLPTTRAWLEVKGDHDERISKVEQFAFEVWSSSGATVATEFNAPLVLLGRPPTRVADSHWFASYLGIRGPGKRHSVSMAKCPHCRTTVAFALWAPECRACSASVDFLGDDTRERYDFRDFVRAPRAA